MQIEITHQQYKDLGRTWELTHNSKGVSEVFAVHPDGRNLTKFYANKSDFQREVSAFNSKEFTCYTGIQARKPELLKAGRAGENSDVMILDKLYLDIDPERKDSDGNPVDKVNATDSEKEKAVQVARKIQQAFIDRGYQKPILCDSGNGCWLFFSIPGIEIHSGNWEEMNERLKVWGRKIISEFSEDGIKIDSNVFDLRRITKVFGTRVFNYPDTPERPQRVSCFLDDFSLIPDSRLREEFLSLPVKLPEEHETTAPGASKPYNLERMFERCYTLRFLKEKGDAGINLSHSVRLALSGFALAFDDLNNDLFFIKTMLGNCPDFSEDKTRYYLEKNREKGKPYSCRKLRETTEGHFKDFEPGSCNCELPVSFDETGNPRKQSPIRFAYFMSEDLDEIWNQLAETEDPVKKYEGFQKFSAEYLSMVDPGTAKVFLNSKKESDGLKAGTVNDLLKISKVVKAVKKETQAETLCSLVKDGDLFVDSENVAYMTFFMNSHRETWPVRSKGFRRYLVHKFFESQGKPPSNQGLLDALGQIEATAHFSGVKHDVFARVAFFEDRVFIDLANEKWDVVQISKDGYKVVQEPPVKFRRARGMGTLPFPEKGTMDGLRAFLNVKSESDWNLFCGWLVGTLSRGPYPILMLQGEQGVGKSVVSRITKKMIDPSSAPLRTVPTDARDLMIAARNSWLLGLDNLSGLPGWLSDALCRLSTGGGFSTRELYSDDSEILFDAMRPLILNGIDNIASRHDLIDRSILIELESIPEEQRKPESEIWGAFDKELPSILGGLYDCISSGLRNVNSVKLPSLPRMADFAIWAVAAEKESPWSNEAFIEAYQGNRNDAIELAVDGDSVSSAVQSLLVLKNGEWQGTASELLDELNEIVPERTQKMKAWPKLGNHLSARLKRASTFLRAVGIEISFLKPGKTKGRTVREINVSYAKKAVTMNRSGYDEINSSKPFIVTKNDEGKQDVINDGCDESSGYDELPYFSVSL